MRRKREEPPQIGEIVYLITDPDRIPRLITKFTVDEGSVKYRLAYGDKKSWHYQMEITREQGGKRIEVKGLYEGHCNKPTGQTRKVKGKPTTV